MDSKDRELLTRAAEYLGRHGQVMSDLLLSDEIYRHLRGNGSHSAFEAKVEEED